MSIRSTLFRASNALAAALFAEDTPENALVDIEAQLLIGDAVLRVASIDHLLETHSAKDVAYLLGRGLSNANLDDAFKRITGQLAVRNGDEVEFFVALHREDSRALSELVARIFEEVKAPTAEESEKLAQIIERRKAEVLRKTIHTDFRSRLEMRRVREPNMRAITVITQISGSSFVTTVSDGTETVAGEPAAGRKDSVQLAAKAALRAWYPETLS